MVTIIIIIILIEYAMLAMFERNIDMFQLIINLLNTDHAPIVNSIITLLYIYATKSK